MMKIYWFLPTSRDMGYSEAGQPILRESSLEYLESIAVAGEALGYEGFLTPAGSWAADGWISAALLSTKTERIKYMIALRPGLLTPLLAAQMAATFEQLLPGRVALNIVTGGDPKDQQRYGDFNSKSARYERTDEFLEIVSALWRGERVNFSGTHFTVADARLANPPASGGPHIYLSGSSEQAVSVAARRADAYLCWGEPPSEAAEKIQAVRKMAMAQDRDLTYGTRFSVLTRDTEQEAWREAERMLAELDPDWEKTVRDRVQQTESEGQRRTTALTERFRETGDPRDLIVAPNVWAGLGLLRAGVGTMLVGSHAQVADVLTEYCELGFSEFILGRAPHLEEAYAFGEGVLPILEQRGLWEHPGCPPTSSATKKGGTKQETTGKSKQIGSITSRSFLNQKV